MENHQKLESIPNGLDHIRFAVAVNKQNRAESDRILRNHKEELGLLGTSLAAIYESSTCHRECRGGDHLIEAIGSRIYNLLIGSYSLLSIGLYDESQSLIRSVGEIANLLSLSMSNPEKFREWANSSKFDRVRNFGPAQIRKLLESSGLLIMDKEWYSHLCEEYTHITPDASPNNYDLNRNACGGIIQKEGVKKTLEQITNLSAVTALYFCAHSHLDDYFSEIQDKWSRMGGENG